MLSAVGAEEPKAINYIIIIRKLPTRYPDLVHVEAKQVAAVRLSLTYKRGLLSRIEHTNAYMCWKRSFFG